MFLRRGCIDRQEADLYMNPPPRPPTRSRVLRPENVLKLAWVPAVHAKHGSAMTPG
jgi:hypothetical protein